MIRPTFTPIGLVVMPSFDTLEEAIREAIITDMIYGQTPTTVTVQQTRSYDVIRSSNQLAQLQAIAAERKAEMKKAALEWLEMMQGDATESSEPVPPPVINGLLFKMTCCECPEQYDILKEGQQVAYSRLRHGCLEVRVPDHSGEVIFYSEQTVGDGWLKIIANAIIGHTTPPIIGQIYECVGKGGSYECLGLAKPAGEAKDEIGEVYAYRCTETGQLYFRLPSDFNERMRLKGELQPDHTVDDLGLSTSTLNILKSENIYQLTDLLKNSAVDLLKLPNFGKKRLSEVLKALAKRDLRLKDGA